MKRKENPISVMDSVDVLDLMNKSFHILRKQPTTPPWLVEALRNKMLKYGRLLRPIIGEEDVLSERYGQSRHDGHRPNTKRRNGSAPAPRSRAGAGKRKPAKSNSGGRGKR